MKRKSQWVLLVTKSQVTADIAVGFLSPFIERKCKSQLEVSENTDVIFFPIQIYGPHGSSWKSVKSLTKECNVI